MSNNFHFPPVTFFFFFVHVPKGIPSIVLARSLSCVMTNFFPLPPSCSFQPPFLIRLADFFLPPATFYLFLLCTLPFFHLSSPKRPSVSSEFPLNLFVGLLDSSFNRIFNPNPPPKPSLVHPFGFDGPFFICLFVCTIIFSFLEERAAAAVDRVGFFLYSEVCSYFCCRRRDE